MDRAVVDYLPESYPGAIVLFRAEQPDWAEFTLMDESLGWKPHVQGGVEVVPVSGLHLEVFKDPHVEGLTAAIDRCLSTADAVVSKENNLSSLGSRPRGHEHIAPN
jgi:thioesterase domain-containing protein